MTSLVFWVSRLPVGSSAKIREGRVIRARPMAVSYTHLKVLDSYIPNVARMKDQLRKYNVAFTKTAAENEKDVYKRQV